MKPLPQRVIQAIRSQPWAIHPDWLPLIEAVAERRHDAPELVKAREGKRLENSRMMTVRDGVAIIPVIGVIIPHADFFAEISGATSLESLALDLQKALDDPEVKAILLQVDSPGGVAFGNSEFAAMLRHAGTQKPLKAYVMGMACSAAYWIASAAPEIVINDQAMLGSIGVVATISKQVEPNQQGFLSFEITSSNAPNKRPDPSTPEGRAMIVQWMDQMEAVFIDTVAQNRSMTRAAVIAAFDSGGVKIGQHVVDAGMADRLGTFEQVLAELAAAGQRRIVPTTKAAAAATLSSTAKEANTMDPTQAAAAFAAENPAAAAILRTEGETAFRGGEGYKAALTAAASAERSRIVAIHKATMRGHEELAAKAITDGTSAGDFALAQAEAEKVKGKQVLANLKGDTDAAPPAPPAATATQTGAEGVDASAPIEDRAKAQWDKSPDLRAEFGNNFKAYLAYAKADDSGQVRMLTKSAA